MGFRFELGDSDGEIFDRAWRLMCERVLPIVAFFTTPDPMKLSDHFAVIIRRDLSRPTMQLDALLHETCPCDAIVSTEIEAREAAAKFGSRAVEEWGKA